MDVSLIESELRKGTNAQALLARFPYVTPGTMFHSFYTDPLYYPAYYHLGKHLNPRTLFTFSFGNGLATGCFLLGAKKVERVLAFQRAGDEFYSSRLAKHNVRQAFGGTLDIHVGGIVDDDFKNKITNDWWEAILIDEELGYDEALTYLRLGWNHLIEDGFLICDRVDSNRSIGRAYRDFCSECNKDELVIKSKYGIGIIQG